MANTHMLNVTNHQINEKMLNVTNHQKMEIKTTMNLSWVAKLIRALS